MAKKAKQLPKMWRDVNAHREQHGGLLVPAEDNPYCLKCGLCENGAKRFLKPSGSDDPWITVVFDGVSPKEDDANQVAVEGSSNGMVRRNMEEIAKETGFPIDKIRWLPLTRCANRMKGAVVNYKTHGNWCRTFAVDDLMQHPPRMVLAVGSIALGHLSHKSNAYDWAGKILTWRGWPDDWLTVAQFDNGHPALPRPPLMATPLYAVQSPRIVFALQNARETARWKGQLREAMELAAEGTTVPDYDLPYFELLEDPDQVIDAIAQVPLNVLLTYDTETTGLLPFAATAAIVAMMFRYDGPDGPVCFGFPWDYPESPLFARLEEIKPLVLELLYRSKLQGHNLTFDILYTYSKLGADLRRLTQAMSVDTRHLIYTLHQTKESLGLELVAYRWCPEMAGYEEEFTLIKDHSELAPYLDPASNKGGHYSKALLMDDSVRQSYKTYIMGDVEVCHVTAQNVRSKLNSANVYEFPLSNPEYLGTFRTFRPPPRTFVYEKIMLPANRTLTRMMGRGLHVNQAEVTHQENIFPKMIKAARDKLRKMDDRVVQWCEEQEATVLQKNGDPWQLDLENRDQLKHILFNIMQLPVKRITDSGEKKYGKMERVPDDELLKYAAVDKYTINALAAEHKDKLAILEDGKETVPLMEYRKLHKAYTAFVRSMRNITTEGIDKKDRKQPPYLQADGRVHASFNQCGTRSGRLGVSRPNLQQLPKKTIVKRMYDSRYGDAGCIYQGDLSQIELRLLAAACGDPLMVDAYRRGVDLHSLTASNIFKIPYEHLHKDYFAWLQKNGREKEAKDLDLKRAIAKTCNFLTGYGGGGFGLQTTLAEEQVYLELQECEDLVDALFDTYPTLRKYIGRYKNFILEHGCAVSIFGRVRPLPEVESEDNGLVSKALRAGFNHLIQSTASDMMLLAMSVIDQAMYDQGLESCLVSTVHDSFVIDARIDELPAIHDIADSVVNNLPEVLDAVLGPDYDSAWCRVLPLTGDAEVGKNYYDQMKLDGFKAKSGEIDWEKVAASFTRV